MERTTGEDRTIALPPLGFTTAFISILAFDQDVLEKSFNWVKVVVGVLTT